MFLGLGSGQAPGAAGQGTAWREARDTPWSQHGAMARAQVCVATGAPSATAVAPGHGVVSGQWILAEG